MPLLWRGTDLAFVRGNYGRAEMLLGVLIWVEHDDVEPHVLKAWLEWSEAKGLAMERKPYMRKLRAAVKTYRAGREHHPHDWRICYEEGMMWESFGDEEKSREAYRRSRERGYPYPEHMKTAKVR